MREISLSLFVTFFVFFSFVHHAYRSQRLANFYDLYIKRRVFAQGKSRGLDDEFSHLPPFPQDLKSSLRPMTTSNGNNSGIFKDRSKMFAPKVGFSGSGNLTAPSKFVADRPLLPWEPTNGFRT